MITFIQKHEKQFHQLAIALIVAAVLTGVFNAMVMRSEQLLANITQEHDNAALSVKTCLAQEAADNRTERCHIAIAALDASRDAVNEFKATWPNSALLTTNPADSNNE